jgi:hypothetical protein
MTLEDLAKAIVCLNCGRVAERKFIKEFKDPSHPEQFEKAYFYKCIVCRWHSEVKLRVPGQ